MINAALSSPARKRKKKKRLRPLGFSLLLYSYLIKKKIESDVFLLQDRSVLIFNT